ncbi:MAG: sigma-70 family RNA polymerase sigma factor [Planctomycetes bacterium]|nr:sigma-70 family RNA polymerase sigma factor [Planctomycetota bacterium]
MAHTNLTELINSYDGRLRGFIGSRIPIRLRRFVDEDDLMQDIWHVVGTQLDGFKYSDDTQLSGWLFTIARGRITDLVRQAAGPRGRTIDQNRAAGRTSWLDNVVGAAAPQRSPSSVVAAQEGSEMVVAALSSLCKRDAMIARLHWLNNMNNNAIAELLGLPESRIRSSLWCTRRRLKKHLGGSSNFY